MTLAMACRIILAGAAIFGAQASILLITGKMPLVWQEARHIYIYEGDMLSFTAPKNDPKFLRTAEDDGMLCHYWNGLSVWTLTMTTTLDCPAVIG